MKYLLLVLLVLVACDKDSDYVHQDNIQPPQRTVRLVKIKEVLDAKVDILWVIDNSGSMSGIQNNVIRNSGLFMEQFLKNEYIQWNMGVISTSENEPPALGFAVPFHSRLTSTNAEKKAMFVDGVRGLGTSGDATELTFYNIIDKFDSYAGFRRPNAHLAVIMVSDEEEQSEEEKGAQYNAVNFLNAMQGYIDSDYTMRFYGAFEAEELEGCNNRWNYYEGSPFQHVINATGGFHLSACKDFGAELSEIGQNIISMIKMPSILLKHKPKLSTLRLFYEGKELKHGREEDGGIWYYEDEWTAIHFYNLNFAPDFSNEAITVEYDVDDGHDRETL